jgi:hypothetical protein
MRRPTTPHLAATALLPVSTVLLSKVTANSLLQANTEHHPQGSMAAHHLQASTVLLLQVDSTASLHRVKASTEHHRQANTPSRVNTANSDLLRVVLHLRADTLVSSSMVSLLQAEGTRTI